MIFNTAVGSGKIVSPTALVKSVLINYVTKILGEPQFASNIDKLETHTETGKTFIITV